MTPTVLGVAGALLKSWLKAVDVPILRDWIREYFHWRYCRSEYRRYIQWLADGRPVPPPPHFKQMKVRSTGGRFGLKTLVETGTYEGRMVEAVAKDFARIYTIELDPKLSSAAMKKFRREKHVKVLQGDSAAMLPSILSGLDGPVLFWLDAHYSGGNTARGAADTAILNELRAIGLHVGHEQHVLLIDDAREFTGGAYPTLDALRGWCAASGYDTMEVQNDIIMIFSLRNHPVSMLEVQAERPRHEVAMTRDNRTDPAGGTARFVRIGSSAGQGDR